MLLRFKVLILGNEFQLGLRFQKKTKDNFKMAKLEEQKNKKK